MPPPSLSPERAKLAEFYSARSALITPLHWQSFAPPFPHLTGQSHSRTSVVYEHPTAEGDPYYPIPRPENRTLLDRYLALAEVTPDVSFVGRLASYRYYNMDQVVGQALATWRRLKSMRPDAKPETAAAVVAVSAAALGGAVVQ